MKRPDFSTRKNKSIVVVGSLNMDLVMRTPRVPVGGETLTGHEFSTLPGGKGANQSVACARLGAKVAMIGRVGDDGFGQSLRDGLVADGIDVSGVKPVPGTVTGVAMIIVEDIGQNRIILADNGHKLLPIQRGAEQSARPLPFEVRCIVMRIDNFHVSLSETQSQPCSRHSQRILPLMILCGPSPRMTFDSEIDRVIFAPAATTMPSGRCTPFMIRARHPIHT